MRGYTDSTVAAPVIDAEGWLHTGDMGRIDSEGFLTVTGRLKHMIVNSTGDKLSPEPIENLLKESRFILESVIVGEGRSLPAPRC